jgi:hypothetical protein
MKKLHLSGLLSNRVISRLTEGLAFGAMLLGAVIASAQTLKVTETWSLAAGDRPYLTSSGSAFERSAAYNPVTGHTLLAHRASAAEDAMSIIILDSATGEELGSLDLTDVSGGTFSLSQIKVADDGAIYGANLSTATQDFRIYRWADETSLPMLVYQGRPGGIDDSTGITRNGRFGDNLDVRGSGLDTEILAGSGAETFAALIVPDETAESPMDTFKAIPLVLTGITGGDLQKGVAFGEGNSFFAKRTGTGSLRLISYTLPTGEETAGAGSITKTYTVGADIAGVDYNSTLKALAGMQTSQTATGHQLMVYDVSTDTASLISAVPMPQPNKASPNAVGGVDFRDGKVFAVDGDNGIVAATVEVVQTTVPPSIVTQPAATLAIVGGGYGSLTVAALGSKPLTYQWQLNDVNITGETGPTLNLTNVTAETAGAYTVVISNSAGEIESNPAAVTISPSTLSDRATVLWSVAPGSASWMTDGNTERGLAYNAANNHLLVVSRTGTVEIHVLDAATGEHLWTLNSDPTIVAGSNPTGFRLNMIGVADDGAVYAANLDTGGSLYSIYRWDDDSQDTVPALVWTGNPAASSIRLGDTFDVRGAGVDTQILTGSNNSPAGEAVPVIVFTTSDGINFDPHIISVPDVPVGTFRLGLTFGEGNTFWGKTTGQPLREVSFDLETGEGAVTHTYDTLTSFSAPIAVQASSNLLAVIAFETPDNVQLYDISDLEAGPALVDQDFFPYNNPNLNGTGSLDFAEDRLFALDSNNGIIALKLKAGGGTQPPEAAHLTAVSAAGGNFSFLVTGTPGATYRIESTTDFKTTTPVNTATVTLDQDGKATVTEPATGEYRFFQAVAP